MDAGLSMLVMVGRLQQLKKSSTHTADSEIEQQRKPVEED